MLAFVIAPTLETSLRQTLELSQGSVGPHLLSRPITLAIMILIVVLLLAPLVIKKLVFPDTGVKADDLVDAT